MMRPIAQCFSSWNSIVATMKAEKNLKRRRSEFLVSRKIQPNDNLCCNFCGTVFSLTVQNGLHKCTTVSRKVLCIFNLARDRRSICLSIILDLELYCMALRRFVYCELKNHVYQLKNNQTCNGWLNEGQKPRLDNSH